MPGTVPGTARGYFVAGGRIAAVRPLPPGPGAHLEVEAGLAAARRALQQNELGDLDELFLVGTFLRRPPPELAVVPLERAAILAAARRVTAPRPPAHGGPVPGPDPRRSPDNPGLF